MAKKSKKGWFIGGGALALFLLGRKLLAAKNLDYRITSLTAPGISRPIEWLLKPTLELGMELINPTTINYTFQGFIGTLWYEDAQIGTINSTDNVPLPAGKNQGIKSIVRLSTGSSARAIVTAIASKAPVFVQIRGELNFIGIKLPVEKEIALTLE